MSKKKKQIPENYYIVKGSSYYSGEKTPCYEAPLFTSDIEKAKAFRNVYLVLKELKTWSEKIRKKCQIYVRSKKQ